MSRPDETWMWERARSLIDQADRLHRQFFQPGDPGGAAGGSQGGSWEPPVDVFETLCEVWILVALPGVASSDVEVHLVGPELVVRARRTLPPPLRAAALKRLEIPRGHFERRLELSPGSYELAKSEMIDGCLALNLRKLD